MTADLDRRMMARAIVLAERGRSTVRPNPAVGCVIVRDDEIVGEGWHEVAGGAHAEVAALHAAGDRARGATAYVSLEPCDHTGRTGPCSRALLEAGIARVVYGAADPAHGGARTLADAGLDVTAGVLQDWAETQNEAFLHAVRTGRPFVTLKLAQTLDGRLQVTGRDWLTGPEARRAVHEQRSWHDAVLVGSGTVLTDDPRLDVRHVEPSGPQPRPVVLDARGRVPADATVIARGALVYTTGTSDAGWRAALSEAGAELVVVPGAPERGVDVQAVLEDLGEREIRAVYAEGGAAVAASLTSRRLVDRLVLHIALGLIGPSGMPQLTPAVAPPAGAGWSWRTESTRYFGADLELVAAPTEE